MCKINIREKLTRGARQHKKEDLTNFRKAPPILSETKRSEIVMELSSSTEEQAFLILFSDHQFLRNVPALRSNY
jgi:hypothetical protein